MSIWVWVGFLTFIVLMIALDLGVFHREAKATTLREALGWTTAWVTLALSFNVVVYFLYEGKIPGGFIPGEAHPSGKDAALQFLTGYLLEYSLSVDNIFVIALIIQFFRVPAINQHRLLFWGVLGAVVFRGIMIGIGTVLMERFSWTMNIFGLLLIYSAYKMLMSKEDDLDPDNSFIVRITRRMYPVSSEYDGDKFFTRVAGIRAMTPMFLALVLIESSDVMFAIDSIPAIFGVTQEPFLVFTSNIFAILGLRSLYFALAGLIDKFRYLKLSLVFLLGFIGVKILVEHNVHAKLDSRLQLGIIALALGSGVVASLVASRREEKSARMQHDSFAEPLAESKDVERTP